jgi:uncharacterized protein YjbJ (UPF0337 family)
MHKNRIDGSIKQAKGIAKETVGKVLGDSKLAADGRADRTAGKIQNTLGGIKDTLKK